MFFHFRELSWTKYKIIANFDKKVLQQLTFKTLLQVLLKKNSGRVNVGCVFVSDRV